MSTPRNCTRSPNRACAADEARRLAWHGAHHERPEVHHDRRALELRRAARSNASGSIAGSASATRSAATGRRWRCARGPCRRGGSAGAGSQAPRTHEPHERRVQRASGGHHVDGRTDPDVPGSPSALALDSRSCTIDRKLATRRTGLRTKGAEAHVVLAGIGIGTVGRTAPPLPPPLHRPLARRAIRDSRLGAAGDGDRDGAEGVQAADPAAARRWSTVTLADGTGHLDLTFFNQPWAAGDLQGGHRAGGLGHRHALSGPAPAREPGGRRSCGGDERDLVHTGPDHAGPPAPRTGITTRTIRELVFSRARAAAADRRPAAGELLDAEGLVDLRPGAPAHPLPRGRGQLARARERLKFDELFTLELGVAFRKHRWSAERTGVAHTASDGALTDRLLADALPFEPTEAQTRAIDGGRRGDGGAAADERPAAGRRRLREDARRASHACLVAIQSGHQAAIMAPTEVLAGAARCARSRRSSRASARRPFLDRAPRPRRHREGQGSLLESAARRPPDRARR